MNRRTARRKALEGLFQVDVGKLDPHEVFQTLLPEAGEEDPFLHDLYFGTIAHMKEIDELIAAHLNHWTLERLANVDRNIMRLAVFELKYMDDIPPSVSINEAVEIAKIYGDGQSPKFINGVLSKVKEVIEGKDRS
jgi:transcription antitermination factor NusB